MIEHYLDTIARNYLRAEECNKLADEIKYAYKAKIKTYNGRGECTGKYKNIDAYLLGEAFEQMAKDYKDKSVKMLQHQMEIQE